MRNVVILGMHRSGTSMVAEALASAGIYVGEPAELLTGQEDNPHGFWEREDVVTLDDAILAENGATWYRPPENTPVASPEQTEAITAIVDGMPSDRSWLIKDPRQVLTWPLWEEAFTDAVVLYVYRNPFAVAASLQRRNDYPLSFGFALWEYYNQSAMAALQDRDVICLSYETIAANAQGVMTDVLRQLGEMGVACERQLHPGVFDTSLGKSRVADRDLAVELLSPSQRDLALYCEALCSGDPLPSRPEMDQGLWPYLQDVASAFGTAGRCT